jgi:hypothetical protein
MPASARFSSGRVKFACPSHSAARRDNGVVAGWCCDDDLMQEDVLRRLRAICMRLPEAVERASHGEPAWFVGTGKQFVSFADHHHDDKLAFWCAAPVGTQQELVGSEPDRYFVPPYVGARGWLGVRLDVPADWDEIAELVEDAYRVVAPRRLVALLNASRHSGE